MPSSGRYTTIEWVGSCNRCWRMYVRGNHLTSWLRPKIKKAMYVHWADERFRHRCLTNKANKVLAKSSMYTGGSATKARM
ncbi:hypothetical protein Ahy_B04g072191 [Arachis hypogaea]|uniref:Uncharacterized protein n=1 Tax=Arachis hypogaea TaxID=3818 RepID=A0A444ZMR6_ARAHY|nr:hypothetical protein Ahy_B04g072191 [Arachis hypogaea]